MRLIIFISSDLILTSYPRASQITVFAARTRTTFLCIHKGYQAMNASTDTLFNDVYDEQSVSLSIPFVPGVYSQVKNREERLFTFDPLSKTA